MLQIENSFANYTFPIYNSTGIIRDPIDIDGAPLKEFSLPDEYSNVPAMSCKTDNSVYPNFLLMTNLFSSLENAKVEEDKVEEDRVEGDEVEEDKVEEDRVEGDKVEEDRVEGDKVEEDKVEEDIDALLK